MTSTSLTQLLEKLSEKEIELFSRYHRCYFPKHKVDQEFLDELLSYHPDYHSSEDLTKEGLFNTIYPGKNYNNKRYGTISSQLKKKLELFLGEQQLKKDAHLSQFLFAQALREKKEAGPYYEAITSGLQALEKEDIFQPQLAVYYLLFHHIDYYSSLENKMSRKDLKSAVFRQLLAAFDHLKELFEARYIAEMINRQRILGEPGKGTAPKFEDELLERAQKLAQIYGLFARPLPQSGKEKDLLFHSALQGYREASPWLSPEDRSVLFSYISNLAALRIREGQTASYLPALYRFTKEAVELGLFDDSENLNSVRFINLVEIGANLGEETLRTEIPWLENFISNYYELLPESYREEVYHLATAFLFFAKKDFGEVGPILQRIKPADHSLDIRCRYLTIQVLYHTEEVEVLFNHLTNFETWLRRKKPYAEKHMKAVRNYLKMVRYLAGGKFSQKQLREKLKKLDPLVGHIWLTNQVENYG